MRLYSHPVVFNNPALSALDFNDNVFKGFILTIDCIDAVKDFFSQAENSDLTMLHSIKNNYAINSKQFNTIILMIDLLENEKHKVLKEYELCIIDYVITCLNSNLKQAKHTTKTGLLNNIKDVNINKKQLTSEKNAFSRKATREKAKLKRYILSCSEEDKQAFTNLRKEYLKNYLHFQQEQLDKYSEQINTLRKENNPEDKFLLEFFRQCFLTNKRINSNDRQEFQYWNTVGAISNNISGTLSFKLA